MEEVEYEISIYHRDGGFVAEMHYGDEMLFLGTGRTEEGALDALLAEYTKKVN